MADNDNNQKIYDDFSSAVNMTKAELKKWLASDEAKSVGIKRSGEKKTSSGGEKSKGYESGEMIVEILSKNKTDLSDDDYSQMKRVTAYMKRHLEQKPSKEDIKDSRWRYSLMNWGHDPLK